MSIMDIAELARKVVLQEYPDRKDIEIGTMPTADIGPYHINSDKIYRLLGYRPRHTIEGCGAGALSGVPGRANCE